MSEEYEVTRESINALKGMELKVECYDGVIVKAYVAQADIDKGITIMGHHPVDSEGDKDIILNCLHVPYDSDEGKVVKVYQQYMQEIHSGYSPYGTVDGGDQGYMDSVCAFL